MKLFFLSFFFVIFIGCSSLRPEGPFSAGEQYIKPEDLILFESAFKDLGAGYYARAVPPLKQLAEKYKGYDLEWAALYNLASAYKELNQCQKALSIYQFFPDKVKQTPQLLPRVFLNQAYAYECLGQSTKTLMALKEGLQHSHYLSDEMKLVEYPARLSLAYFRMNEPKTGKQIQQKMYDNLEVLKKSFRITSAANENFARYFYIIGRSHVLPGAVQLKTFLRVMPYYQMYLSQSILLFSKQWSIKAEAELGSLYKKLWSSLKQKKNKTLYKAEVKKILAEFRNIVRSGKNEKLLNIYKVIRKKTMTLMAE